MKINKSLKYLFRFQVILIFMFTNILAQQKVEKWDRFEVVFKYSCPGNSFKDVALSAVFAQKDTSIIVSGFYDGNDTYRIRFMPGKIGLWNYSTSSNINQLNNKKGTFECINETGNNHGPVRVSGKYNFKYADGKRYYPFGTTSYAWTHMKKEVQEITLNTLANSGFNKIRMCVFPKNYNVEDEKPEIFPYEIKESKRDSTGKEIRVWNYDSFNPQFFQNLEKRIDDLSKLGIEADIILFHPYDEGLYGFDSMPMDVNINYIKYLSARISSFRNVWWSMANEFDYVKSKTHADWDILSKSVVHSDPYRHLCSIHGSTATYFEYWKPEFTHVSIQDNAPVENMGSASILRNVYSKPIIYDEVNYEGNLAQRWGRMSGEEMTYQIWLGVISGTYVTHGEAYSSEYNSDKFLSKGGILKGTSWKRIAFLRKIVEDAPAPLQLADLSRDNKTATSGDGYYIIYFGKEMNDSWPFNLPAKNADYLRPKEGMRYKVEIIDTWDMTITEYPQIYEATKQIDYRIYDKKFGKVRLPLKPYLALRITEVTK